ncbi:MAG: glycosyltransferase family 4 protein [Chloroflexota bacterium]
MKVGLAIYGSLDSHSGGYLFDRMLVSRLRERGDVVEIVSMPRRRYAANLLDNLAYRNGSDVDVLVQDELNHPSLLLANRRLHRSPIISIVHHLRSSERRPRWENAMYRLIERGYLNSVDGFVFNSEVTRESVQLLARRPKPFVVATPGGDRLGRSTPEHVRQRALRPGPLRLIYVGSLTPAKGLDVLIDALAVLPRADFSLDVVGASAAAPRFAGNMRRMAEDRRLPVSFCGELDDRALEEKLRNSHVMVLPSYYEGFGIAYLEGMAHGLPALGTVAGAIPDLVSDGVDGYLVSPGDARVLADRILALGHKRKTLARLGLAALRRFDAFPTWEQTTERIRDFLLSVALR